MARKLHQKSETQDSEEIQKQLQKLVNQIEVKAQQIDIVTRQLHAAKPKSRKIDKPHHSRHQDELCKSPREASLRFLQKMKAIQNTLQQDDLKWD